MEDEGAEDREQNTIRKPAVSKLSWRGPPARATKTRQERRRDLENNTEDNGVMEEKKDGLVEDSIHEEDMKTIVRRNMTVMKICMAFKENSSAAARI